MENIDTNPTSRPEKNLPGEVIMAILDKLDVISKIRLRRVCHKWNNMLRDESLYSTLRLTEDDMDIFINQAMVSQRGDLSLVEGLAKKLFEHGISQCVQHLIVVGDYNYSLEDLEKPNAREKPFKVTHCVMDVVSNIGTCGYSLKTRGTWKKLESVTIKNGVINSLYIDLKKLRLTLSNVSVLIGCERPDIEVEFFIENFTAIMSGKSDCMWDWFDEESCTDGTTCCFKSDAPAELCELFAKKARSITAAEVNKLEEVYDELVKGREGCVIRQDAIELISLVDDLPSRVSVDEDDDMEENDDNDQEGDDDEMEEEDDDMDAGGRFARLDAYWYFNLVYYSEPRNFYRVASEKELRKKKDKHGYPLYTEYHC